jgi:hypothetical protein
MRRVAAVFCLASSLALALSAPAKAERLRLSKRASGRAL